MTEDLAVFDSGYSTSKGKTFLSHQTACLQEVLLNASCVHSALPEAEGPKDEGDSLCRVCRGPTVHWADQHGLIGLTQTDSLETRSIYFFRK